MEETLSDLHAETNYYMDCIRFFQQQKTVNLTKSKHWNT